MKHQRLIPLSAAITALCLTGILQAAQPSMPTPIDMFDKDGSGTVSEEEFNAGRAERMAKMAESGRPMRHAGQGPQFSDLDADKDGEVTLQEFIEARRAMMERRHAERMARRSSMPGAMPPMHQGYGQKGGCMQRGGGQGMDDLRAAACTSKAWAVARATRDASTKWAKAITGWVASTSRGTVSKISISTMTA